MTVLNDQLAPGFLIAPPSLTDPNFDKSVVLLAAHDEDGSMGFIVNRYSEMTLHELLADLEIEIGVPDQKVLVGGPVSGFSGFVLYHHEPGEPLAPGMGVLPHLSITPSRDVLIKAAAGELRGAFELLLGYSGWGPGQLDVELERGGWLHAAFDAELLDNVAHPDRWEEIYARLGVSPMGFINVPGGAQA